MGLFDNFGQKAGEFAKKAVQKTGEFAETAVRKTGEFAETAVKKTGEIAETTKLTVTLKTEEMKLKDLYEELGKLYYESADKGKLDAAVMEIDEKFADIRQLKLEIAAKGGKVFCSKCEKEIDSDAAFCPFCGEKNAHEAKAEDKKGASAANGEKTSAKAENSDMGKSEVKSAPMTSSEFISFFETTMKKYKLSK